MDLIDFYKTKSKYLKYAGRQICFHYRRVKFVRETQKDFVEFLRSKETIDYVDETIRSFTLNVSFILSAFERIHLFFKICFIYKELRCKNFHSKEEKYQLYMCFSCSLRTGPFNRPNKNSCFVCGSFVFENSTKYAYVCQFKHNQFNFPSKKCIHCKQPFHPSMQTVKSAICMICSDFFCSMFDI